MVQLNMSNSKFILIRLPQTLLRGLAIPNFTSLKVLQTNIERKLNFKDSVTPREAATYLINNKIIESIGMDTPETVLNIYDNKSLVPEHTIIDSNLAFNSKLPSFRKYKDPVILPYDSVVHNPIYSDLSCIKGFVYCLKDSLYFRKGIRPKYVYDWAGMICKTQNSKYIPWFWKPLPMDLNLYLDRIQIVSKCLGNKFTFLNRFQNSVNPILFLYSSEWHQSTIENTLLSLYENSEILRNQIDTEGSDIFVKPHRAEPFVPKAPINYFKGSRIVYAESLTEHFIPSELFINSKKNEFLLVSEWSSTLFNHQIERFVPIKDVRPSSDFTLLLAGHRLKSSINFNPYENFT